MLGVRSVSQSFRLYNTYTVEHAYWVGIPNLKFSDLKYLPGCMLVVMSLRSVQPPRVNESVSDTFLSQN
jgi:hypothetical protein